MRRSNAVLAIVLTASCGDAGTSFRTSERVFELSVWDDNHMRRTLELGVILREGYSTTDVTGSSMISPTTVHWSRPKDDLWFIIKVPHGDRRLDPERCTESWTHSTSHGLLERYADGLLVRCDDFQSRNGAKPVLVGHTFRRVITVGSAQIELEPWGPTLGREQEVTDVLRSLRVISNNPAPPAHWEKPDVDEK